MMIKYPLRLRIWVIILIIFNKIHVCICLKSHSSQIQKASEHRYRGSFSPLSAQNKRTFLLLHQNDAEQNTKKSAFTLIDEQKIYISSYMGAGTKNTLSCIKNVGACTGGNDGGGRISKRKSTGGGGDDGGGDDGSEGEAQFGGRRPFWIVPFVFIVRHYSNFLEKAPLLTKSISTAVISCLGDFSVQLFEEHLRNTKLKTEIDKDFLEKFKPDFRRLLAVTVDAACISGPGLHVAYNVLEGRWPTVGGKRRHAWIHAVADSFFLDPMFICSFFVMTGTFEGKSLFKEVLPQLKHEYAAALQSAWALSLICMPVQYAAFRYLPFQYRVLVMNVIDIGWTATLSFHCHRHRETSSVENL